MLNEYDSGFFYSRAQSQHPGYAGSLRSLINDEHMVSDLVEHVFCGHRAIFSEPPTQDRWKDLSWQFYRFCYRPPTITLGFMGGRRVSESEFVEQLVRRPDDARRNRVLFLLGDVGVGKSAFINSLITKHGQKWVSSDHLFFLRLDLEEACKELPDFYKFVDIIARKLVNVMVDNKELCPPDAITALADLRRAVLEPYEQVEDRTSHNSRLAVGLFQIMNAIRDGSPHRRLLLVIDNIDYITHLRDRELFEKAPDSSNSRGLATVSALCEHLHDHNRNLGKLGATVLFVMRPDTYDTLAPNPQTSLDDKLFRNDRNAFTLSAPSWDDVLRSRHELIERHLLRMENYPAIFRNLALRIAERMSEGLKEGESQGLTLLDHLKELTNYGLREMMQFFSHYAWMPKLAADEPQSAPVLRTQPVALLTFILNMKRRYSQLRTGFPNIYLVQSEKFEHPQTYWLKRLVASLLQATEKNEFLGTERIIEIFAPRTGHGYSEELVRLVLGSLADANRSNLIRVRRHKNHEGELQIDGIAMTPRGRHFLAHVVDRFFYLQLIVDDFEMPTLRILRDIFDHDLDYGYLVGPAEEYGGQMRRMIKDKSRLVLAFVEVLGASLEAERKLYPSIFERLAQLDVPIPNMEDVRTKIVAEIDRLSVDQNNFISMPALLFDIRERSGQIREAISRWSRGYLKRS